MKVPGSNIKIMDSRLRGLVKHGGQCLCKIDSARFAITYFGSRWSQFHPQGRRITRHCAPPGPPRLRNGGVFVGLVLPAAVPGWIEGEDQTVLEAGGQIQVKAAVMQEAHVAEGVYIDLFALGQSAPDVLVVPDIGRLRW